MFHIPWLSYCSGVVAAQEHRIDRDFMAGVPNPGVLIRRRADAWLGEVREPGG